MGRTVLQFLSLGTPAIDALIARACEPDPRRRFASVADFYEAWSASL
jgi:hypothetical protein